MRYIQVMNLECKLCNYKNSIKVIKENNKMDWLVFVTIILLVWFFTGMLLEKMVEEDDIPQIYRYK
jgi:hypothetical protein